MLYFFFNLLIEEEIFFVLVLEVVRVLVIVKFWLLWKWIFKGIVEKLFFNFLIVLVILLGFMIFIVLEK